MITVKEMKYLEDLSEENSISKQNLMENAGRQSYLVLKKRFKLENKKILVVCYHGNNGGDGFVLARYLHENEIDVKVEFIGNEKKLKKEAKVNFDKISKSLFINNPYYNKYDIIVDAILGTGIKGKLKKIIKEKIIEINCSKKLIVSLDVPSGIDPDSGVIFDQAVKPNLIITFHDIKTGLVEYKEITEIVDIGIKKIY